MPPGVRTEILYVDLMKFGDLVKIRRISEVTDEDNTEVRQNNLAIYDGKLTRYFSYPKAKSLDEAVSSAKGPVSDVFRPSPIQVESNENPLQFLREALGIPDHSGPMHDLLNSLGKLKSPVTFEKSDESWIARFESKFQTGEIEFRANAGYLPTARIYGESKRGVSGENRVEYTRATSPAEMWFPKLGSIKTYYTENSKKSLLLELELKVDLVEIENTAPEGTFELKSPPGGK